MSTAPIYLETCEHTDCCGRSHLFEFPDKGGLTYGHSFSFPMQEKHKKALREAVKLGLQESYDNNCDGSTQPGHVVEVTLTDSQAEIWEDALVYYGFDRVARFRNNKSGNFVRVYLNNIGRSAVRRKIGRAKKG